MMIDGESFETIMEETHLRLKDLKRIQHEENKFMILKKKITDFLKIKTKPKEYKTYRLTDDGRAFIVE